MMDDNLKCNFKAYEYVGIEIYPFSPGIKHSEEVREKLNPIATKDGIKDGDQVFVGTFHGWVESEVRIDEYGSYYGETEHCFFPFEFGKDDRRCWVCYGQISKKAIEKLEI